MSHSGGTADRAVVSGQGLGSVELIVQLFDFNLAYARALVGDLSEEQMTHPLGPGLENHPAFTLGHLVTGAAMMVRALTNKSLDLPAGWKDLFARKGPSDRRMPQADRGLYPTKEVLLAELERQHTEARRFMREADDATLAAPMEWRFDTFLPSTLAMLSFMATNHEALHLGQIAAWRRGMGLPGVLGDM